MHDGIRNGNFLRSGQLDDLVTDIVCFHEGFELRGNVFVDEGSVKASVAERRA